MTDPRSLEAAALAWAHSLLAERRPQLTSLGLEPRVEIERWQEPPGAEIRVSFWRDTALVDFFEDFVVKDGELVNTEAEIKRWLAESIDETLQEASE